MVTLITVVGNSAYEFMVSLYTPTKTSSKTYTQYAVSSRNENTFESKIEYTGETFQIQAASAENRRKYLLLCD